MINIEFAQFRVRELVYAAGRRMERHAHDYSNVTVVIRGDLEETTDCGEHRGRAGSVLLKPAGTMHANYVIGGTRTVSVEMHDASLLGGYPWQWLEGPDCARAALALVAAMQGTTRNEIEERAFALVEAATGAASQPGTAPPWLDEVKNLLEAKFDEPLRFDTIAKDFGLHPVYLSRAFHRHTGMSMGDYVRALRLRHARHLLSATARPLASISAEAGFADASHLCRVFARAHAVTPRAFRDLCGGGSARSILPSAASLPYMQEN